MQRIKSIAVIGLGLIGGSILKGLKGKGYELIGVARREETVKQALEEKIIDKGSTNIDLACESDIIFVCTPINKTLETIIQLSSKVQPDTLISDVASLKKGIIDFVNTAHDPINFIGGHPMAGTENKGLEASFGCLFKGAKWVLTPSKWSNQQSLDKLSVVIRDLEADIIIAEPEQHDKAVALISHFPVLLSETLFGMVENYENKEISELALALAASGFRDTTRLAMANPELARDMLFENKENVLNAVKNFKKYLETLENLLKKDEGKFMEIYEDLAAKRKKMYISPVKKGSLFVISGPSGVGKGTLVKMLMENHPELALSVSATTRTPRQGEVNGVNYFFLAKEEFKNRIDAGEFFEWAEFSGNFYGTNRKFVEKMLNEGKNVILEIEVQGALQVKSKMSEVVLIFIEPPSLEELKSRLIGRNTEKEEEIQRRLAIVESEYGKKQEFDFVMVNDKLDVAYQTLENIIMENISSK